MGWLALKLPQANLYMSAQGSAVRSMEERSRLGRGFSGGRGAGVGAAEGAGCVGARLAGAAAGADAGWASEEGARAKQARAAIAVSERSRAGRMEARTAWVSLMLMSLREDACRE